MVNSRRFALLICVLLSGCAIHLIDHMTGEDEANRIRNSGLPATARVLELRDTGMTLNQNPVVSMRVEVHADGVPPFEATLKAVIGRLDVPRVQPGAEVPVKFDPKDHSRVALDRFAR